MTEPLLDAAGRRRSSVTMPGSHAGCPPRSKRVRYLVDSPTIEEIVTVMRAGDGHHGPRLRGLIVLLWRRGLRINYEALALDEPELDGYCDSLFIRHGKGGRRREVGLASGRGSSCGHGWPAGSSSRRPAVLRHRP
jgi:hypothetical protein